MFESAEMLSRGIQINKDPNAISRNPKSTLAWSMVLLFKAQCFSVNKIGKRGPEKLRSKKKCPTFMCCPIVLPINEREN
ncbi:hypothetical protein NPIL_179391 [Nephila pilipes]|uniref:Uncharacterized protein n=1 Tax=Nephila pilipes TaxID=299642 RepID=A0A8X6M7S7_NEPPI|nr:hypothetical protein NPIL_179391 [Nephila pilipes]